MKKSIILLLFVSQFATAGETWFCTEDSSKRNDNVFSICGVGDSLNDEGAARKKALDNAIAEFETICEMSSDCRRHKMTVEPKRTSCGIDKMGLTKCYRLIEITVVKQKQ